jgi:hypothetical protein
LQKFFNQLFARSLDDFALSASKSFHQSWALSARLVACELHSCSAVNDLLELLVALLFSFLARILCSHIRIDILIIELGDGCGRGPTESLTTK